MTNYPLLRKRMIEDDLVPRGIQDPHVLKAMAEVPRELFVPNGLKSQAYDDNPLPIGEGQTISQPFIVALMLQAATLKPTETLLEIGTGSGYAAAVASRIVHTVITIERIAALVEQAKNPIEQLKYNNIHIILANGTLGYPKEAPYDAIIVTAAGPKVPEALLRQLAIKGRLIIPVGDELSQKLLAITKQEDGSISEQVVDFVRFVPLIGEEGW